MKAIGRKIVALAAFAAAFLLPVAAEAQRAPPPALPELPGTPVMSGITFPECRDDYLDENGDNAKAEATNICIQHLDAYHAQVLADFRTRMIAHQEAIRQLYENEVMNDFRYTQRQADSFFAATTAEHEASNPDGAHMATYRALNERYWDDRRYLQERFCIYVDCPDDPEMMAAREAHQEAEEQAERQERAERRADRERRRAERRAARAQEEAEERAERDARRARRSRESRCNSNRGVGGILGGILGGVIGEATGAGAVAGFAAGAFAGVLVGEIACQLEPEEQEEVARVTEEITQQEEVGATASWVSPTREDVSGTSTVTALVSQPNGAQCMDVTDIIIVEGEETRVSKRMCRAPGETRYVLAA